MKKDLRHVLLCLVLASSAWASESKLLRSELRLPTQQSHTFDLGALPQQDATVLLKITARLNARTYLGSGYFIQLHVNDKEVMAAKSRTAVRLINRPLISPVGEPGAPASWFSGAWRGLFAANFQPLPKGVRIVGEPYTLIIDITDLVNPISTTRLKITNTATDYFVKILGADASLVLANVSVIVKPGKSPMMAAGPDLSPVINTGQPGAGPAPYRGELLAGGGFALTVDSRRWELSSAFSYPRAGLNRLVARPAADSTGQPGWKIKVQATKDGGEVVGQGRDYRLHRVVRFTPRRVEISDTLTNAHADAPLGLLVRHAVDLRVIQEPMLRLAGNPDPTLEEYYSAGNPSVHIAAGRQSLGLLCEDDVFRNQVRLFATAKPAEAGLATEMLRLGPGESYTLRWAVCPVASADYYDFVNLVRQDWGANFTLDGAWTFYHADAILDMPVETIQKHFRKQGIRYAMVCGGWIDLKKNPKHIGFGADVLSDYWADYRRRLRESADKIRRAAPGVKVMVYYDTQRDTCPDSRERFKDSRLIDAAGVQFTTGWDGAFDAQTTCSTVATLNNSFGKAMLRAVDTYLDDIKLDGLYWDEMEAIGYGMIPPITYNTPDGHSCILNPKTYTIDREVGISSLLGEGHRLAVIDRVQKRGGPIMGNTPPMTRKMLLTKAARMVEVHHNHYFCYETNLGTPFGYVGTVDTNFEVYRICLRKACLPVGVVFDLPHEISRFLFPFTPIELHSGYLLGKERLVTLHSGSYGWVNDRSLVQVRHFDREGKLTAEDYPTVVDAEARTAVQLKPDQAAVLVRLPVTLTPKDKPATVSQVQYTAHGLSLHVNAPGGAVLEIRDGDLPIAGDQSYPTRIGSGDKQSLTARDGILRVNLPAGTDNVVQVQAPAGKEAAGG